jgi:hypothetical protein
VVGGDPLFAVVHGLYWLAVNAGGAGAVLIAVDDLHWADQASQRFVLYLADRLAGLPAALALSWRAGEAGAGADRLARLEQIAAGHVESPAPLSRAGVRALLTEAFRIAPAERLAAACHAVTGGNPFLLRELIQNLRADGIGPGEHAVGRVAGLGPRSVARSVALRVARLGSAAGELARAAAVLGDGEALRHAAALAGIGPADAAAAADALAGIGVFAPGTPLRFVHPIVRTAVHEDIPGPAGACGTPRRRGCWPPRARTWTWSARTCWCASRPGRLRWWSGCGRRPGGPWRGARPRARPLTCGGRWRKQPMWACAPHCCTSWAAPRSC